MVLKSAENIEKLLSDSELHLVSEDGGSREELSYVKNTFPGGDFDLFDGSIDLYLAECSRTPLLTAREEKTLGSRIEDGKYLSRLEQELVDRDGLPPSETDLLIELAGRFDESGKLFETLCRHLGIELAEGIEKAASHSRLRRAIDGHIDQHLSGAIAGAAKTDEAQATQDLVELSLSSRLIPWHIITGAGEA